MVAEPTLFLSKDRKLQVRACTTRSGWEVFCVKDFIRQIANRTVGPNDAMIYWLNALGKLMHEENILKNIPVRFAGPYEGPNICIGAEGLLILYHYLDDRFGLVSEVYRIEVQDVLMNIIAKGNAADYVCMHDDGEIDELVAEKGDRPLTCPPTGSKYIFVPEKADTNRQETLDEAAATQTNEMVSEENAELVFERVVQLEKQAKTKAKPGDPETFEMRKRRRTDGFCIKALIAEMKITDIPTPYMNQLCKRVITNFKTRFPDRETSVYRRQTLFCQNDRQAVISVLRAEHLKLRLWLIEHEGMELGINALASITTPS